MAAPAYQNPTEPTAISAVMSEGLFTAWQLARDIPQLRKQLMERHGMTKNWYATLRELGLGSPLQGPAAAHYEKDWIKNNFLVGSIATASTGVGTNVIIILDTTSMYTTTIPGAGTVRFSYPAQWDVVKLPDGTEATIIAKDVTTNPALHRLTLRPKKSTVDLAGKVVAGGRYFIASNGFGEGTYGATPKISRIFRFENGTQIIKSAFVETGSSMTNKLPIKNIKGQEGSYMIIGSEDTERLQMDRISGALWFGTQGDNITVVSDATGTTVPVKYTQGLDDFIEQEGNILPFASGNFDIDTFDALGEIFNRERIKSKDILMPAGFNFISQFSTSMKDFVDYTCFELAKANTAFKSDMFGMTDAKDFFLWLDFQGVRKNGFNFLLKHQAELDEQQGAGTEGYNWRETAYAIPVESFRNADGTDGMIPSVGYRYKELNGYNREMEIGYTGGAGKIKPTSSLDAQALDIRSEIAGEYGLGNQMVKLTPQ